MEWTFPCGDDGIGMTRHDGKAMDQYVGHETAATDTKPRTGVESATTVDISNSAVTHGDEGQDMALGAAGRCVHGAKRNRVVGDPAGLARQRVNSHMTTTSTTRMTSTNVTRDRGMPVTTSSSSLWRARLQQPDAVAERAVEHHRDPVGQQQHDGHHDDRLGDESEAGQPQLDAVPPIQDAAHPASLRCVAGRASRRGDPATCGHAAQQVDADQVWRVDDVRMVLQHSEDGRARLQAPAAVHRDRPVPYARAARCGTRSRRSPTTRSSPTARTPA